MPRERYLRGTLRNRDGSRLQERHSGSDDDRQVKEKAGVSHPQGLAFEKLTSNNSMLVSPELLFVESDFAGRQEGLQARRISTLEIHSRVSRYMFAWISLNYHGKQQ